MSDSPQPPGGPPNAEFRDAIVELANQAREEDLRAEAEIKKRLAKRPFAQFVRLGLALIALQIVLYLYLSHRRPVVSGTAVHTSIFPASNCNAVLYHTYWKVVAFERDNGRPPTNFEEMLGKYLDKLPIDPASGKSLLYTTQGDHFELHCPGSSKTR